LAIKPADNESFYREVDEQLRKEQLTSTWKRYGILIVAAVVLLLAAIGGYLYWQNRQEQRAGEHGELLTAAFDDIQAKKTNEATEKLDRLAADGGEGYRAAAMLTRADLAVEQGNEAAALAAFKAAADDGKLPEPYREVALIRQTALEYDRLQPSAVIDRLGKMAVTGNPWFGSAGEMVAIAHLRQQRPQQAAAIFAAMAKEEGLPESIRSRALQMAGALGVDAVQQADDKAAATKENTK
jgi:hypothetical protein